MSTVIVEADHSHVFLGSGHESAEKRTWAVIALCGAMMVLEIVDGSLFGSIALIADGLHMSAHAGAMLLAALAYSAARRYAHDPRFTFGTGKLGDLAGFTSAIVLAMIALLIGYEAISRFFNPVPIRFTEAIPIAVLGLAVNVASAWLLSGGAHGHHHHGHGDHGHGHRHHGYGAHDHGEGQRIQTAAGPMLLTVFEDGVPPVFQLRPEQGALPAQASIETVRSDGARQVFALADRGQFLESVEPIPEPHEFTAVVHLPGEEITTEFREHAHAREGAAHRDNNMRAAVIHVMADAAVSVLVIVGLLLALAFGWLWMDPLAGIVGAFVIASWSWGLIRDTGAILLDMVPDRRVAEDMRRTVEMEGDRVTDLHLWRLGPGHLGAILSVRTEVGRGPEFYRRRLTHISALSHLTVEVDAARSSSSQSLDVVRSMLE